MPERPDLPASAPDAMAVLHFYDLTCPFCYLAGSRDRALEERGARIVQRPFRAHPEVPPQGVAMGARHGPMYDRLERDAAAAGLPLRWPPRLPSSRTALGAAEWARINRPAAADVFRAALFAAHFADGRDIGDPATVLAVAAEAGVAPAPLRLALEEGAADALLLLAEAEGRRLGVAGTPAWSAHGRTVAGLQSVAAIAALLDPEGGS